MPGRSVKTLALAVLLTLVAAAGRARADGLLDRELTLAATSEPDLHASPPGLHVAAASAKQHASGGGGALDFDLLGDAPKPSIAAEDPSLKTRRKMLTLHQGLGLGLLGLQVASTVTGQLNYSDKFGTANTGRYKATHQVLVYSNLAAFAVVGGIALFAPTEKNAPPRPFGRTTIHKIGMALATAGMISQGVLGIRTAQREGYLDKQTYGRAHLAVGYATLAAMSVAVGAIVF